MPSWGLQQWGFDHWAIETLEGGAAGTNAPVITLLKPVHRSTTVNVASSIALSILDPDSDLDVGSIVVKVDGAVVFTGSNGFSEGYSGATKQVAQGLLIEFLPTQQWSYDQTVALFVSAADVLSNTTIENFTWQFESNPRCYTGLAPLPIEVALQSPFDQFVVAERVRQVLIDATIKGDNSYVAESGSKAARAILQVAYSTELRTLLNRRLIVPSGALGVTVCERDRDIAVDRALKLYIKDVRQLIDVLRAAGVVPQHYVATLNDYLDSNRYQYRVSAVATLVVLAKTLEL